MFFLSIFVNEIVNERINTLYMYLYVSITYILCIRFIHMFNHVYKKVTEKRLSFLRYIHRGYKQIPVNIQSLIKSSRQTTGYF